MVATNLSNVACVVLALSGLGGSSAEASDMTPELIVLAAPVTGDPYYAAVADDIFAFHVGFAQAIRAAGDEVLILADEGAAHRYAEALGAEAVLEAPVADIWARDFGLATATAPVMFRYTAAGQGGGAKGQADADAVQDDLALLAEAAGLVFAESDLLNDGGNFVDDDAGNVVLSTKFLRDNQLDEAASREVLQAMDGITHVAFVEADEQGGLEHADGVVAFVDTNTLIVNSYPEDPSYARALHDDLQRGLPGVTIHEITTPYDGSEIYDERFGSACGLYTNALVTPERVYLPQFGIPEDEVALAQVRAATDRAVVPIPSSGVCAMGGGVRCLSWQLRGANAAALLHYARSR